MAHKRTWALKLSATSLLLSLGVIGFGCASNTIQGSSSNEACIAEDEACDGEDNDCDGQVDEGCACLPGATQGCYSGPAATNDAGQCKGGTQTCDALGQWGACEGEVLPAASEACDGLDNTCDGMVDEGCACSPPGPQTTKPCFTGAPATEGVGACIGGTQSCQADGTWSATCAGEVKSTAETCDTIDNDCNGVVDDMGMTTCGVGACQVTVIACEDGQSNECASLPPALEVCDGIDNDCDQLADETFPDKGKACTSALPGVCAAGKLACQGGAETCVPTSSSTSEKCDGLDNDCDGVVDDNVAGTGSACSSGFPGVCNEGMVQCQDNVIDCYPIVAASPEVCDGLDNDCNSQTDEGNPGGGGACDTGTPGLCAAGTLKCLDGSVQCIANAAAQPETCDGIDNNCDGQVDENNPGGGVICLTGLQGACSQGVKSCTNGALVCNANIQPTPEMCDGLDNDCNGVVDQNNPGGGAACTTSLPGACTAGTITCQNGALSCKQNVQAVPEICGNSIDDNCDGVADPNIVTYFTEDFANNSKGWTLGTEWQIGSATASSGQSTGNADPAQDHSPSADNGVAGVVIGGNASTAIHSAYYLTSPIINLSGAATAYLEYWRFLNSDYAPYMVNTVDVYNGSAWVNLWTTGTSPGVVDTAWTKVSTNVSAHVNAQFRVRFGFSTGSGVFTVSQWNLDDIQINSAQCN